ncbi:hypothetical protein PYW08_016626 [Mythimna loreyi]|uniref:Uncharacterized protein n=1 Tax=Mythimna loreyi TaxID=667449 RepID=A0ACC2QY55_9NEOP|nr:hypothetical protein PYW08_016626 [Mythimna loreyi]
MIKLVIFTISVLYFKCWARSHEMRESELWDIKEFNSYLKFSEDSNQFDSTRIYGDIQQYRAGLKNEDIYLNVSQLIYKYGYPVEEHKVKTEDGYIVSLIRIPSEGPAVLLMHGLTGCADDWVVAGTESGMAYLLANEGYDVWLGNARGNKHSRAHVTKDPSTFDFWDFSWDEIGRYDLPAIIDYVLDTKNQTQLIYVGHSQGSTVFFVMASELPAYNDKISLMVALSAPTAIPNIKSPLLNFLKIVTLFHPEHLFALVKEMGFYEFFPSNDLVKHFTPIVCGTEELAEIICSNMMFQLCGFNAAQLNISQLPVIFAHQPGGASTKQVEHYSQAVLSGKFRRFDYEDIKNIQKYGAKEPPEYAVEKITTPIVLFYSDNDWLVSFDDTEVLRKRLKNVVEVYQVPDPYFNHVDYLFAKDVKTLVFNKLSSIIKAHL